MPLILSRTRRYVLEAQSVADQSWSEIHSFDTDKKRALQALDDMTPLPGTFRLVEEIVTRRTLHLPVAEPPVDLRKELAADAVYPPRVLINPTPGLPNITVGG